MCRGSFLVCRRGRGTSPPDPLSKREGAPEMHLVVGSPLFLERGELFYVALGYAETLAG